MAINNRDQEDLNKLREEISELKKLINDAGVVAFFFTLGFGLFTIWSSKGSWFINLLGMLLIVLSVIEFFYFRRE